MLEQVAAPATDAETDAPPSNTSPGGKPVEAIAATRRPISRLTYAGIGLLTSALSKSWRLTIDGVEHIPPVGPAIIAANHVSFLDSPLLMFELPRRVWFFGKSEYLESRLTRVLFPALGMIPLERSGGKAAMLAMREGLGVLGSGECLGLFPEGTRSRDGNLHRGHTGLAWLAFKSGAPIIPVGIRGTDVVQPPDAWFPKLRGTCSITIGEPIDVARYGAKDRRSNRILTDDVMFEISQLSGQRYVDRYAETQAAADTETQRGTDTGTQRVTDTKSQSDDS